MVDTITNQYVARFHNAARASRPSCQELIERMDAQTAEMLVNCGKKYQNTRATIASDTRGAAIRIARCQRRPGAAVGVSGVVETLVIAAVLAVRRIGWCGMHRRRRVQLEPAVAVVVNHLAQRVPGDEAQAVEHRGQRLRAARAVQLEVIGDAPAGVDVVTLAAIARPGRLDPLVAACSGLLAG